MTKQASSPRRAWLVAGLLALATVAVYWQSLNHNFLDYDDQQYVTENPRVTSGLTAGNVAWAFTSNYASNWHPLTWLSHMLDCQIYGLHPPGHHLTNLLLHTANVVLLFLLLLRASAAIWPSAIVAALFALHPAHSQSVAWIAERKDVLSTCFLCLAALAYLGYAKAPVAERGRARICYLSSLALFACGLMSKPMIVTLPCLLLLLDFWPLGRIFNAANQIPARFGKVTFVRAVLEKMPFFLLAAASCAVTVWAQNAGHSLVPSAELPLGQRLVHALAAYLEYLGKAVLPMRLSVFYPYEAASALEVVAAVILLVGVTFAAFKLARSQPWFVVGWLWFLGALVPVIGIVQVGDQAMADRYTYLPFVGLFIMFAWGLLQIRSNQPAFRAVTVAACVGAAIGTFVQLGYWRDTRTLFEHTASVTKRNYVAAGMLGSLRARDGNYSAATQYYADALRYNPDFPEAHLLLGNALDQQGRWGEAMAEYDTAIRLRPNFQSARLFYGVALAKQGRNDDARAQYLAVLKLNPDSAAAHNDLAKLLHLERKFDGAVQEYRRAVELDPRLAAAHNNLGVIYLQQGNAAAGADELRRALRLEPDSPETRYNLLLALNELGRWDEAAALGEKLAKTRQNDANAAAQWGRALAGQGKTRDALSAYAHALLLDQNLADALNGMAWILSTDPHPEFRNGPEALKMAQRASELNRGTNAEYLVTLGAAYAETGRFDDAVAITRSAQVFAQANEQAEVTRTIVRLLEFYRANRAFRTGQN